MKPLATRDAEANNLLAAFDQPPADPPRKSKGSGDRSRVVVPAVAGVALLLAWRARRSS